MTVSERFDHYLDHLSAGLGHADRRSGLRGYCTGLMLPLSRKSVEPMAATSRGTVGGADDGFSIRGLVDCG